MGHKLHSSKGVALSGGRRGPAVRVLKEKTLTAYAPRRFSAFGVEWSANMTVGDRRDGGGGRGAESNRSPCPMAHERALSFSAACSASAMPMMRAQRLYGLDGP